MAAPRPRDRERDVPSRRVARMLGSAKAREALLLAAMLTPVALDPGVRRSFRSLDRRRQAALALMVGSTLAGQFALGSRSFPFVDWDMYTKPVDGDPLVFAYHAALRGGDIAPIVPSAFLGTDSAARLMEGLRRQVCRILELADDPVAQSAVRREHELALKAIAGRFNRAHADDPAVAVLVSERTVSIRSGEKGDARLLWRVEV